MSLGPVVQYSAIDSTPARLISQQRPYGFGTFGQVGARLSAVHESREERKRLGTPDGGRIIEVSASWYPEAWDVD